MPTQKMFYYAIAVILFFVLFSLYGFWQAIHPPRFIINLAPQDLGWEYKDVTLTTEDNIKLAAWFVPASAKAGAGKPIETSDKVIILLHGYPADKANLLCWSQFLHEDFNLFFVDFRYFGDSEGKITTIGLNEQKDLEAAINYLKEKSFNKIGAMGFSLGGAVAIMVGAKDSGVHAIVSDSAYAGLSDMSRVYYKNLWILEYPLSALTSFWSKVFLGTTPNKVSPERSAQELQVPILVIHSKEDTTIPFENALKIKEALKSNPDAQFFFLEKGVHGALPPDILEEYEEKVLEFFHKYLQ